MKLVERCRGSEISVGSYQLRLRFNLVLRRTTFSHQDQKDNSIREYYLYKLESFLGILGCETITHDLRTTLKFADLRILSMTG